MKIILNSWRHHWMARVSVFLIMLIMATLIAGIIGCDGGPIRIYNWYQLDSVRDNLGGSYVLVSDLDATDADYSIVVGAQGGSWEPIGSYDEPFNGTFDGQDHEIKNVIINRPAKEYVGLFGVVEQGVIKNLGVVNAAITGHNYVGGLAGQNKEGTISNCHVIGSINGEYNPVREEQAVGCGGLVGWNEEGTVSDSYSTGNVTGNSRIGGLVGLNVGPVDNSYSSSTVIGGEQAGGLVGHNMWGRVSDSYSTGDVTGCCVVGGLVGYCWWGAEIDNSHYNYDEVLINSENAITIGALSDDDFEEWMANDKFLDIDERLSQEDGYYAINNVNDFKELLAFGQDDSLKFRLNNDLDLAGEPNFYVPYLAGEFDGDGHSISNLSVNFYFAYGVGLFGYLYYSGKVSNVGAENVNITSDWTVGGLVGYNEGIVSYSHSTGSVNGHELEVGGLVGYNCLGYIISSYSSCSVDGLMHVGGLVGRNQHGDVSNCYSTNSVTGSYDYIGGLVGWNQDGDVSNCYSTSSVTGDYYYVGGLVGWNEGGTVDNSFWNTETSGQATSDGGTGKTTAEMQDISTFSDTETEGLDESWDIIAVANPSTRNPSYTWNIVADETYPFLSW